MIELKKPIRLDLCDYTKHDTDEGDALTERRLIITWHPGDLLINISRCGIRDNPRFGEDINLTQQQSMILIDLLMRFTKSAETINSI